MTNLTKTYAKEEITSVGKTWMKRHPEIVPCKRQTGESIEKYRLVREDAYHRVFKADTYSPTIDGATTNPVTVDSGNEDFYMVQKGPCFLTTYGSIEPGEFKVSVDGKIVNFIKSISGRTILSATAGNDGEITQSDANGETLTVVSSSSSDTDQYVTVYGLSSGSLLVETIDLNGTTAQAVSSNTYNEILAMYIGDRYGDYTTCAGTVTLKNATSGTTLVTISAGNSTAGIDDVTTANSYYTYDRKAKLTIGSLEAVDVVIEGYDYNGAIQREIVTWAASNEAVVKETTNRYNRITRVINGDLASGNTIAISGIDTNDIRVGLVNNADDITTVDASSQSADGSIVVVSDDASDTTQTVTVFWKNAAGTWSATDVSLNGTTNVAVGTGDTVVGAYLDSATAGTVSVIYDPSGTPVTLLEWDGSSYLGAGVLTVEDGDASYTSHAISGNNGKITVTSSNTSATDMVFVNGYDVYGDAQVEGVTLSSGAATTTKYFSKVTDVVCSGAAATEYFTISNETDDDGKYKLGRVYEGTDTADTIVECFLY